ncbi:MAG: hypothetical protein AAFS07_01605 [Pseudomonadota bacterium]
MNAAQAAAAPIETPIVKVAAPPRSDPLFVPSATDAMPSGCGPSDQPDDFDE